MSFSNRKSRVKDQIAEPMLETLYGKASESEPSGRSLRIGSSRSIVVSPGAPGANCCPIDGGTGIGVERSQSIRHFGNADVSCETRHVQPIHDGKIRERYEDDADDHEPPRSDLDESKRH